MIKNKTEKLNEVLALIKKKEENHTYNPSPKQHTQYKQLTSSDKIAFAYDYYNIVSDTSLIDILKQIPKENKESIRTIIKFIVRHNLVKPLPDTTQEYRFIKSTAFYTDINRQRTDLISVTSVIQQYNPQNWLELFDEDTIFAETKTKHPLYRIFMDADGNKIKFDKELSTKVKLAIINQGLTPARCIVEGAYPHIVKGTFQEYTDKIKKKTL